MTDLAEPDLAPDWKASPDHPAYDEVRSRIVDAAERLLGQVGVRGLRLDAVAAEAGVHRSSVYRYFGGKEEIVRAAVVQATLRIGRQVTASLADCDDPADLLVEGLVRGLSALDDDPVHRALLDPTASDAVAHVASGALAEGLRSLVSPAFGRAADRGVLRPGVTDEDGMRWIMLVVSGLVRSPNLVSDQDDLRMLLRTMLVPALVES